MKQSGRPAAILLVLTGLLVLLAARPPARRAMAAASEADARRRASIEVFAYNRRLTAELAAGRIGLAETADRLLDAHADPDGYLVALHALQGCPTVRESVARSLVFRAENSDAAERPRLRAEYAALFGRSYDPPDW